VVPGDNEVNMVAFLCLIVGLLAGFIAGAIAVAVMWADADMRKAVRGVTAEQRPNTPNT
jgi:hypothetical protein